jgi:hypothetical protein
MNRSRHLSCQSNAWSTATPRISTYEKLTNMIDLILFALCELFCLRYCTCIYKDLDASTDDEIASGRVESLSPTIHHNQFSLQELSAEEARFATHGPCKPLPELPVEQSHDDSWKASNRNTIEHLPYNAQKLPITSTGANELPISLVAGLDYSRRASMPATFDSRQYAQNSRIGSRRMSEV